MESVAGQRHNRSHVSLEAPASAVTQSSYPMHPTVIDGCFQTVTPSLWAGHRSSINAVLVPATVDNLFINASNTQVDLGVSVTNSKYSGRGRLNENKNYVSGCTVYDLKTGALMLELTGLHYHKLDTGSRTDPHTLNTVMWKPDISFVSQNQALPVKDGGPSSNLHQIIDLIAHKKPSLKIGEINLDPTSPGSMWFNKSASDTTARGVYQKYLFVSPDAKALISMQSEYELEKDASFTLADITSSDFIPSESDLDLVIIRMTTLSKDDLANIALNVRSLLSGAGYSIFVEHEGTSTDVDSDDSGLVRVENHLNETELRKTLTANGFDNTIKINSEGVKSAYLSTADNSKAQTHVTSDLAQSVLSIVHLSVTSYLSKGMRKALEESGWFITEHFYPFPHLQPKSTVLILDELFTPILSTISGHQWQAVKELIITLRSKILWLTKGSQFKVTAPENALIHGFFRTVRAEDPSVNITTLDVEAAENPATFSAVNSILELLKHPAPKTNIESEFVERDGVIYVSRIVPDTAVNRYKAESISGAEPVLKSLHSLEPVTMLRAERLGTLDALTYSEMSPAELPVLENNVEVEIHAASLNFKVCNDSANLAPSQTPYSLITNSMRDSNCIQTGRGRYYGYSSRK